MTRQTTDASLRISSLQYRGYASRKGCSTPDQTLPLLSELQNALVRRRRCMAGGYLHGRDKLRHQNASITDPHQNDDRFNPLARRLLAAVASRVNTT